MNKKERLTLNKKGWDTIADDWFGSTSLPTYAPLMATETDLKLFGDLKAKKVLDIGCGSGHSLKYMADQGAAELWGIDISSSQIKNAKSYLGENNLTANLFESPMEVNPGIPENYFDIVYSIYAFGWTVDLDTSINLVSKYLKPGGIFIMSWDHPLTGCIKSENGKILIDRSYHHLDTIYMNKADEVMTFTKYKMSSYVNAFSNHGMYIEKLIEDVSQDVLLGDFDDYDKYYSKWKARQVPLSMIIKARKHR